MHNMSKTVEDWRRQVLLKCMHDMISEVFGPPAILPNTYLLMLLTCSIGVFHEVIWMLPLTVVHCFDWLLADLLVNWGGQPCRTYGTIGCGAEHC